MAPLLPFLGEMLKVAVPALLVIVGWNVVSAGNDKRESRKEKRQLVDKTIKHVDEVVNDAIAFFTSENDEEAEGKAGKILADLKRIEIFIQALSLRECVNGKLTPITATGLRQSITNDGSFWARPRSRIGLGDPLLATIRGEAMQLVAKLENAYLDLYKS